MRRYLPISGGTWAVADSLAELDREQPDAHIESHARHSTLTDRHLQLLGVIVAVGALLRFWTLDARSYWVDEAATVSYIDRSFGDMLSVITNGETTPPLYYILSWLWSNAFGTGEFGLRSLSALLGTATIPVVYAVAAQLVSRRVALVAAVLAAVSPLLVWHAQDARSYALVILLSGLSFLFFVRALEDPRPGTLGAWAVASTLLLTSHYFAVFLVVPEACWLLLRHRTRRVLVAIGAVGVVGVGMLVLSQRAAEASWISSLSLPSRIVQVPAQLLVGYQPPLQVATALAAGLLALVGIWLLATRADKAEVRGVRAAGVIGIAAIVLPIVLAVLAYDRLLTRAVTISAVPLIILIATGFGSRRAGSVGLISAAVLSGLFLWIDIATANDPKFEREDWRGAAQAIGGVGDRVIVLSENGTGPLAIYRPEAQELGSQGARVAEIVLIGTPPEHREIGKRPVPPRPSTVRAPAAGFTEVERVYDSSYTLLRFRAARPRLVRPAVVASALGGLQGAALVEGS